MGWPTLMDSPSSQKDVSITQYYICDRKYLSPFIAIYKQILDGSVLRGGVTNELGKFCSTSTPPPILSSGPVATLRFHSDNSMDDTGFSIAWSVEQGDRSFIVLSIFDSTCH